MLSKLESNFKERLKQVFAKRGVFLGKSVEMDEIKSIVSVIQEYGISDIIDIGANTGQFIRKIRATGFEGRIYAYEPDPKVYKNLKANSKNDLNTTTYNSAILSTPSASATTLLNISTNSGYSSSIFEPTSNFQSIYSSIKFTHSVEVSVETLGAAVSKCAGKSILVKVDAQGAERKIFEDFDLGTERNIAAVQIEVSLIPLYKGEWSFSESIIYFDKHGLRLYGFTVEDFSQKFGIVQANLLFVKNS